MKNDNRDLKQDTSEQGMYGYTGNPFENMDYGLCKKCRHRTIDRSENPDSVLCRECREELIKLKIPPVFYVAGALALALMVFTIIFSSGWFARFYPYETTGEVPDKGLYEASDEALNEDFSETLDLDEILNDGYVITAMDHLVSVLDEAPDNIDAAVKLADIAMKYAYYDYAAYAIANFLEGVELSDKKMYRINGYIDKLNIYYKTYDLYSEIWEELYGEWNEDDDPYAILDACSQKMSEYIGNTEYDQALIYYYLGYMAADSEQGTEYFKECVDINPCYFGARAQIAVYYRRQGDLEAAREALESVYKINKEDYSVLRAYATLELTEGNPEEGLDFASRAYEMYADGDYVADTYIVALAANGRIEEARELVSEYEEDEYAFDDDLYDFLDGNMTLEDYYIGE